MPRVVTANKLRSGEVVYLAANGQWRPELIAATVANDAGAMQQLEATALAAVELSDVTAVYAMDVRVTDGRPEPISVREHIRAAGGPTV